VWVERVGCSLDGCGIWNVGGRVGRGRDMGVCMDAYVDQRGLILCYEAWERSMVVHPGLEHPVIQETSRERFFSIEGKEQQFRWVGG